LIYHLLTSWNRSDYNGLARLNNTVMRNPDHSLCPLRSTTTNSEVPGFPDTAAELATMAAAELDPVLAAFGLPTGGGVVAKRQRLKFYIGLPQI
jgi:hypothetical protein